MSSSLEAHVGGKELALYVIDALPAGRKSAVERHVLACEACAEQLAREACVEAAFEEVARRAIAAEALPSIGQSPRHLSLVPASVEVRDAREIRVARALRTGEAPVPEVHASQVRAARVASLGARRSRWAGGVAGALAAAAALVLAFASSRSEAAGVAQRSPGFTDAAGDMSGAFASDMSGALAAEVRGADALDGG
jgi:hypothetical protein